MVCVSQREKGLPKHYRRDIQRNRYGIEVVRNCHTCGEEIKKDEDTRADVKYCSPSCRSRVQGRNFRNRHPERVKAARQKENSCAPKRIFTRVKSRAKRRGILFDLSIEDIIIPSHCPVLGIPIKAVTPVGEDGRRYKDDSPSVDRIDPVKGYVKGNIRVISQRANLLKSNAELWELEAVLNDLRQLQETV